MGDPGGGPEPKLAAFAALSIVGMLAACGGCGGSASSTTVSGVTSVVQPYGDSAELGIRYTTLGGSPLLLDAHLPAPQNGKVPPATVPAVIFVHGGGFVAGNRSGGPAAVLARTGMAAFSIDYTLASKTHVGFPLQVKQVLAAVVFVRQNAARFRVDPNRIALLGTSAGATLAVLAAVLAPQFQPDAQVHVDVGWSGVYDLSAYIDGKARVDFPALVTDLLEFLGCSSLRDPTCSGKAKAASAIEYVSKMSPPTLLATSDDFRHGCEIVDPAQSTAMDQALAAEEVPVRLHVNHACAHALEYESVELGPTIDFLNRYLSTSG